MSYSILIILFKTGRVDGKISFSGTPLAAQRRGLRGKCLICITALSSVNNYQYSISKFLLNNLFSHSSLGGVGFRGACRSLTHEVHPTHKIPKSLAANPDKIRGSNILRARPAPALHTATPLEHHCPTTIFPVLLRLQHNS